jgi:putative oxidoreductase
MKTKNLFYDLLRYLAAIILLQTLYFKFSGHPQSVELFTKLGVEPWGRIATGVIELLTGILLLIPASSYIGAVLGIGLMFGAILSHLTIIGIESMMDHGTLFILAIIVLVCCLIMAIKDRNKLFRLLKFSFFN